SGQLVATQPGGLPRRADRQLGSPSQRVRFLAGLCELGPVSSNRWALEIFGAHHFKATETGALNGKRHFHVQKRDKAAYAGARREDFAEAQKRQLRQRDSKACAAA